MKETDKELLLTDEEISKALDDKFGTDHERFIFVAQAQLKKAKAHYEPLIEQARQGGRREIIKKIDKLGIWGQVHFAVKENDETMWCLFEGDWEVLKQELEKGG